ncbi:MAG: ABC transporter ATP-binding protein [Chloroflexota bacterium]|nr:MAG: macrolide export ATP-binding/permease protein MacB [Bellilinea sp.]
MMNEASPLIQTEQLVKVYGSGENQVVALAGINLIIQPGEFVAIMGPSGSGKSTLLNILACLDRPSEGRYILAGEDVSDYNRAQLAEIRSQQLGFIFQSYNLLPRLTALENVLLPLIYRRDERLSQSERQERAMNALESVGLVERAHHYPNQLSGGQQQRVAIARALINDPILILADEPTGNLDSRSSEEIIELLLGLNARGRTIVMVTHEPDMARHAQRVLTIRDGRLALDQRNGHSSPSKILPTVERRTA